MMVGRPWANFRVLTVDGVVVDHMLCSSVKNINKLLPVVALLYRDIVHGVVEAQSLRTPINVKTTLLSMTRVRPRCCC